MQSKYFCPNHWRSMIESEIEAYSEWMKLMGLGTTAYAECRIDDANKFLAACFDIALMRLEHKSNRFFKNYHATKPAELLLQLYEINNQQDAIDYLSNSILKFESTYLNTRPSSQLMVEEGRITSKGSEPVTAKNASTSPISF